MISSKPIYITSSSCPLSGALTALLLLCTVFTTTTVNAQLDEPAAASTTATTSSPSSSSPSANNATTAAATINPDAGSFIISDIRIEGLQRISAGSVFNALPINVGDRVDSGALVNASKTLFKTGNFDDLKIVRDGTVLVFLVQERPSISEINIEGNKAIETEALLEGLKGAGLAVGRVFKRSTLEGMQLELQRQYVSQGRYDASIESDISEQPRNRVSVNVNINEGTVAKIRHINIVGNTVFSDEELLDTMELKDKGLFLFINGKNKYSKEKLSGDLETVESYYRDRGYLRFSMDSTQVAVTPNRDAVYITLNITEGEPFIVNKVDFSGDIILEEEELKRYVLVREDQEFSQIRVTKSEEFITNRLGDEGYTFAKVTGVPEINDDDKTAEVKFFIDPGKRTYVRRIEFRGNTKTADEVLRREMRQMESAPASRRRIEQSKVRLERLGFFKEVEVETPEVPGSDDLVDVEYKVEEQSSGSIGASVGYAQDAGLIIGANIQQNNFLGTGKRVGIGINTSKFQTNYSFNYVNPYYTADGVSRGFSIFYRSTDLDEVNVSSFSTDTWGGNVSFGYPIKETQRLGFSLGYSNTRITTGEFAVQEIAGGPRLDPRITRSVERVADNPLLGDLDTIIPVAALPEEAFAQDVPEGFIDVNGNRFNMFPIIGTWTQSTLNRGQLATRGASQSVSVEFSLPGSDLEYYKLIYNGQYFLPLGGPFTLRFRTELGFGDGFGGTDGLPFFENFYAGGFGSVRGFKSNTLGPRSTPGARYPRIAAVEDGRLDDRFTDFAYVREADGTLAVEELALLGDDPDPFGGNVLVEGSVELLFPLPFVKDQRSLRSAFFVDFGNVFNSTCEGPQTEDLPGIPGFAEYRSPFPGERCIEFDADELRYSAGLGLTWITGFGPLTFSLAKAFNKGDFDESEVFQFSIGRGF